MIRSLTLTCAPLLLGSSLSAAQVVDPAEKRGPFSSVGSLTTLEESTRPPGLASEAVFLKPSGDITQSPPSWNLPGARTGNYSLQSLFPAVWPLIEIDAMSTGNAYILTDGGHPQLGVRWAALTISVTNDAVGVPGNGWLERRLNGQYPNRTTPGADLATYYFEEGVGIDSTVLGKTFITQLAEHQGYSENQDSDSLDVGMGVIASGTGEASSMLFQTVGEFYFSLTRESADALRGVRFLQNSMGKWVAPDPATIYLAVWDSSMNVWSIPKEYLTPEELGLDRGWDDIDALDVSSLNGTVVFSTQPRTGRSQLMVYENEYGVSYTLMAGGLPATEKFYLRDASGGDEGDDVDAICHFDPEPGSFDTAVGTAVPGWLSNTLGLSVVLEADGDYRCQVTGQVPFFGSPIVHPGGATSIAVPRLKIYSSWDFDPWGPHPNNGTWVQLGTGIYISSTAKKSVTLPMHNFSPNKPVYFRAEVVAVPSGTLLGATWVSALDL